MNSRLPPEMTIPVLLLTTGWTYQQLMDTPAYIVDRIQLLSNKRAIAAKG